MEKETTTEVTLDEQARQAVHAARNAAQAVEVARQTQFNTAKAVDEKRMGEIVRAQMADVLSSGTESERSIILARVPYICADIKEINASLKVITETMSTYPIVKALVFGFAGLILTSVVGALIALVVTRGH